MADADIVQRLSAGFAVKEGWFTALAYIRQVDEPEFGCEGRPDNVPVCGRVLLEDKAGLRSLPMEEGLLRVSSLDDGMWFGLLGGQPVLYGPRGPIIPTAADLDWLRRNVSEAAVQLF